MTAEGMTSISVSYEVRRQLNTLRTLSGYKSVNDFLNDLIRAHKITKMNGEIENLRERMRAVADVDVEDRVGNSLLQVWELTFGPKTFFQTLSTRVGQDLEVEV